MAFNFTIRKKMMLFIVGVMAVIYITNVAIIGLTLRNQAIEEGWKLVHTAAQQRAKDIQTVLNEDITVARTMAIAMESVLDLPKAQRDKVRRDVMVKTLKSNPKYEAVWMSFELWAIDDSWDKPYGRERATYFVNGNNIEEHIRLGNTDGDPTTGLYLNIKRKPKEVIGDPYKFAAYGGKSDVELLGVSPAAPIMHHGKFAGLIGTDMFLDEFKSMSEITFFKRGFAYLISNDGTIITHKSERFANQPIDSLSYFSEIPDLKGMIKSGEAKSFTVSDAYYNGEKVLVSFEPITIGKSNAPWAVGLEIPLKEITAPIDRTFFLSMLFAIVGLFFLVVITYRISDSIASSLEKTSVMLENVAQGKLERTGDLEINSKDELGKLAVSVNDLLSYLRERAMFAREIGNGMLSLEFSSKGEDDVLSNSLLTMRHNLETFIKQINRVIKQAGQEGDLSGARVVNEWNEGAWMVITNSINQLLDSVSSPFNEIKRVVNGLSAGDLTVRFSTEVKGEISEIAQELNQALVNLSVLIEEIKETSMIVASSTSEMLVVNEEMTLNTREIASSIAEMSNGAQNQVDKVDKSSNLVEAILHSSNEMGGQADSIYKAAQTGSENSQKGQSLLKKVGFSMKDIAAFSRETYDSIQVLTKRSNDISSALTVITDIAAQTNLLALNAAIEAAQAGDAGRGFAVVAEEIRKLAEDSRRSAREIEKLISDVQRDVQSAGSAIEMMKASVNSGQDAMKFASDAFNEITDSSSKTLVMTQEINKQVQQQLESIKNVVSITESVVVIAEQTAAGTEEIASSATELSSGMENYGQKSSEIATLAEELSNKLSQFKI